ncbi:phosphoenolpyruvate--protein phosphotransferase [Halieaceae bacterium IMCC14734]|uniref:phosphoenolpyruvate--protein phosphotransferase n=1 Tax=Candidatus Litorirhabdus singularis TaxID=2518993 RepID=A0ABT3TCR4_9GAMM|nr:phosphoenolpyruvate--protein phosphotransferase [Candidatus Litorirhabdus singularis]MCX2980081.1 phosphoenolpyruvate--protein phosphotransferase [Candidatus Litorirhabdus singularis]
MLEILRNIVQEVNTAETLPAALEIIVQRVRDAMGTEVCTVYMHDPETNRFVFEATEGLNKSLVGKISMAAGEGLVGRVAEREEPLNLEVATAHRSFRLLEGIGEEPFSAFLGVPIIHRREVLGVLVVQQQEKRRFDESDEAFLVTMSAQLAGVIAHARVTGAVSGANSGAGAGGVPTKIAGIAGAPGIAIGRAVVVSPVADLYAVPQRRAQDRRAELRAFKLALRSVRKDIEQVAEKLGTQLNPEEHALFDVYLRILDDATIGTEVASRIKAGQWAQGALSEVMIQHIKHFERMEQSYLRERAVDVKDLGTRVLAYLQSTDTERQEFPEASILVGEELTASVLGEIPREKLVGIISVKGSGNSHVAILARAMGVPTVMGAVDLPYTRLEDQELIIDGYYGEVHMNPDAAIRRRFAGILADDQAISEELESLRDVACETTDGKRLPLWVNTGLMADVARSLDQGAEGVGLYRTEVPFLLRERFPSEEEQRQIYRSQLEAFAPLPVTMRTLDIGGDKALPYFPIEEENPFLGWRGIRVTLDHPEIFLVQVRAMLKASEGLDNLRIMLPMISNVAELDEAMEFIRRAYREVLEEGSVVKMPPVGVMVEVPAAVYQARALARKVDFLSVGSNDLTQYLLAVDRNNARVADLYHAYHPAVLQALQAVADAAHAEGKLVGICGELAGDPGAAVLLLAMGYDVLSMNATNLTRVKKAIRNLNMETARTALAQAMLLESSDEVHEHLAGVLAENGLQSFIHPRLD